MDDKKAKLKQQHYEKVTSSNEFIRFKGATLTFKDGRYQILTSKLFAELFYKDFKFAAKHQIAEVEHLVNHSAPDKSDLDYLIEFPDSRVWDANLLDFTKTDERPVLRSRVAPNPAFKHKAFAYMLQLANNDEQLAWDMLQGLAPIFMRRRPAGVVWFVGGGANGKSALLKAVYLIIGDHLTSMTVAAIEDGRDAPSLQGIIGNICLESSESRVEDTERYKAIGTHEPFTVHKFHSQEPIQIDTDFHTVFNANNIPIFSDKTEGARRRTLIVPFPAKFKDDPNFEARTFTPDFLGGLLQLILDAAQLIKDNGYQYKFSQAAIGAKKDYDSEVNSAEAFLAHLRKHKVKAFTNYRFLRMAYENWCQDHGLVPLGMTNLKRVMTSLAGADDELFRDQNDGNKTKRWYFIDGTDKNTPLISLDNGIHVGLKVGDGQEDKATNTQLTAEQQQRLGKDW